MPMLTPQLISLLRAAQQLPQGQALLLRLGVPDGVLQCRLGHAVLAYLGKQGGHFPS